MDNQKKKKSMPQKKNETTVKFTGIQNVKRIWVRPCNHKSSLDKIQQKLKLFKQYYKG